MHPLSWEAVALAASRAVGALTAGMWHLAHPTSCHECGLLGIASVLAVVVEPDGSIGWRGVV